MKYKIHPVAVGVRILPKCAMTYYFDCDKTVYLPVFMWYLEGGEKKIIVDTGTMDPFKTNEVRRNLGETYTFEEALDKFDLSPEDIDVIIHTHLHNDHCENDFYCENATIYVQRKEYEFMLTPHPIDFRYDRELLEDAIEDGRIVLLEGDQRIIDGIGVIFTPGHTPGGQSVVVDTEEGRAIIAGFCCILENFFPSPKAARFMSVIPPGINTDIIAGYDSVLRVKREADIILPLHEPSLIEKESIG
jgi:glyoxylase-like metal-dependent hydrolase (beta-lactamase superfamily II)